MNYFLIGLLNLLSLLKHLWFIIIFETNIALWNDAIDDCVFQVITGAGHHVYADRPEQFNQIVLEACEYTDSLTRGKNLAIMPSESDDDSKKSWNQFLCVCKLHGILNRLSNMIFF